MEANLSIIDKMLEEHNVSATKEAKEAIINFSVLFGQKLVRQCTFGKPIKKGATSEDITIGDIRHAYQMSKGLRSVEFEAQLAERKKRAISKINSNDLITEDQDDDKAENMARSVMTVNFYNTEIYHMCLNQQHQLTYEIKQQE